MASIKNFSYSTVAVAPSPATSGTSLTVSSGQGTLFAAGRPATIYPTGVPPLSSNAEIVTVSAVVGDVLTIVRAQESTSARTVVVGDQIAQCYTAATGNGYETTLAALQANTPAFVAKGDLIAGASAGVGGVVTVGADGTVLTADAASPDGVKWATPAGGGNVTGPGSAVDGNLAGFNGTSGTVIKDLGTPAVVIAGAAHAATGKTTPVDADELPLVDSAASNVLKKLTWANLKATAKTYFDTLYDATGAAASVTLTTLGGTAPTGTGAVVRGTSPTISGIETIGGTKVTTANPMGALAIDVTKALNTKSISVDSTFTFSGTPGASNQWFGLLVTNSDTAAHTLTIPSSFSVGRAAAITTVTIPASGKLYLNWNYDGSAYNIFGDPPATTGTGSFVLATGGTLTLPNATALPDGGLTLTDVTTNNVSTSKHGFAPKGDNNAAHYLDGTGAYSAPSGSGNVTAAGTLASNAVVLGGATTAVSTVAGITTDGTSKLVLGVNATTIGAVKMFGNTSGDATVQPSAVAGTSTVVTLPNASSTLPIFGQQITFAGPTAARTITVPDASFTVARTDAANTFTGVQTMTSPVFTTPVLGTPTSGALTNCTADGTNLLGYRGAPQQSKSADYTLVLGDAGFSIFHPVGDNNARTFTIPANGSVAYPIGTVIEFINMAATASTIAITTDTMTLLPAGTTGSRTLVQYGRASAEKITSTSWVISGNSALT